MATRQILKVMQTAKQGCPEAQLQLGECYIFGREGLGKHLTVAYKWLSAAACQGNVQAAWLIGEHIPPSVVDCIDRAKDFYLKAVELGSIAAITTIAVWRLNGMFGSISKDDESEQLDLLRKAALAGNVAAQLTLGAMAANDQTGKSDDLVWLEQAAARGEAEAIKQLIDYYWQRCGGELWQPGQVPGAKEGQTRSKEQIAASKQALSWHEAYWSKGGRKISPLEMRRRGSLMLMNRQRMASSWLESAAEGGDGIAAYLLGLLYMGPSYVNVLEDPTGQIALPSGCWFPRNYKLAESWLVKASNAYLAEADFALYVLNGIRNYTQRDSGQRENRLTRAAKMGHSEACWLKGCEALRREDIIAAMRYFDRAGLQGHIKAAAKLDELAPGVSKPNMELLNAARVMETADQALSIRLELGAQFNLSDHEYLLIDPVSAYVGDYLLVDVRQSYAKGSRRVVRVSTLDQRDVIARAQIKLGSSDPLPRGKYQSIRRKFVTRCSKLGIVIASKKEL